MEGVTKRSVTCAGCSVKSRKIPKAWVQNNYKLYCTACWDKVQCTGCGHHDPKGVSSQGEWQCRACRHRQSTQKIQTVEEVCHRVIIDEHSGESPPKPLQEPGAEPINGVRGALDMDDLEDDEVGDQLAPLPTVPVPSVSTIAARSVRQEQGRVVLLLDTSGSMRTCDVDAGKPDGLICRLDAVRTCALDFVERHARSHPNDVFSVVAFSEEANRLCEAWSADATKDALRAMTLQCSGGTFYRPALSAAARCLETMPGVTGHLVLLSDGRPADTKVALEYFQKKFLQGNRVPTHLHGIAFGSTVESFAPLQQLSCISGGSFILSSCSARGLCDAFTSVSSSITSMKESSGHEPFASHRTELHVDYELPELGVFGKKGVVRFSAARATFRYDGSTFHKQEWNAGLVERRERPYMRGGMRLVYGFNDAQVVANGGGWMVAKTSRFASKALNSIPVVEAHAKSTAVARYFAALFGEQVAAAAARDGAPPTPALIFVPCFVYTVKGAGELAEATSGQPAVFAAERYLPGVFLKYNSNNGYVSEGAIRHDDAVQAFLHFSFVASGATLAVTDLQGVARDAEVLLTDPQVLTTTGGTYGPGDVGSRGLRACLAAHRCGPTCKKLGLKPISGPVLRRLEAGIARGRGGTPHSTGSWEHVIPEAIGTPAAEWERLSEHQFKDMALSDGVLSSQASTSSWVHLDS